MKKEEEMYSITKNIPMYGNLTFYYSKKTKIASSLYLVTCQTKNQEIFSGIIDEKDKTERIPIDKWQLTTYFKTKDEKNICVAFQKDTKEQYFHLQYQEKGENYALVTQTSLESAIPLSFSRVPKHDDYWIITLHTEEEKYALYHIQNHKIVSDFFDILDFEEENAPHYAYFCQNLEAKPAYDEPAVKFTTLIGFLNKEAQFSSYILDSTRVDSDKKFYSPEKLGYHSLSRQYQQFKRSLLQYYLQEYERNQALLHENIAFLYDHPIDTTKSQELEQAAPKGKIMAFRPKKNE